MRHPLLGLVVTVLAATSASAQSQGVSVSMGLSAEVMRNGARKPVVYLRNLLADERWNQALDNSLPLIVTYSLQTWRSRDGWIDELATEFTWQSIITKEPLQEEYSVILVTGTRPRRPLRFPVRDSALKYLNLPQMIETYPQRPGRFYYTVRVKITALSDRDMDQLERFLAGDPDLDISEPGSAVGRGVRRFLLRIAGLPSQQFEARTEQFVVRPNDEEEEE